MCPVCKTAFHHGQVVLAILPAYDVVAGQKDPDYRGFYPRGDASQAVWIHHACAPKYFNPDWNDEIMNRLEDEIRDQVADEVEEATKENMYQQVLDELLGSGSLCSTCSARLNADERFEG